MYSFYLSPGTLADAVAYKDQYRDQCRIIAGGTDLLIELERGLRKGPNDAEIGLIDLSFVPGLANITIAQRDRQKWIDLGPLVTHNQCVVSAEIVDAAFPLARACWEVGAPQIRNRATVAGNLITASPANDTIVPLMALDAEVTLQSLERGDRALPLKDFMTGFRQVDMVEDEILTRISCPAMQANQRGTFIKLGLRRAQAISVISVAIVLDINPLSLLPVHAKQASVEQPIVRHAAIALGAVAPVVVRADEAESFLVDRPLTDENIDAAANLALEVASPIDDVRASADYRGHMVKTLVARGLRQLRQGQERAGWTNEPVTLWGKTGGRWPVENKTSGSEEAIVNGQPVALPPRMTLLDSLRAAGYVGVKEGCAEGECGSCTIFLDGMAVMACMVPAERAHGSQVTTVEGLGTPQALHRVQQAFIDSGGVQCGYCTPGFVMSAAKLLEERPQPTRSEVQEALTGNLCRCTGYRKIIDAVMMAAQK